MERKQKAIFHVETVHKGDLANAKQMTVCRRQHAMCGCVLLSVKLWCLLQMKKVNGRGEGPSAGNAELAPCVRQGWMIAEKWIVFI